MISVIIPVKNGAEALPSCLQALRAQQGLEEPLEVLVVDDGSTDQTVQIAQGYGVRVISQPNQGPAAARNTGAHAARGHIVAFTDADCEPAPDWLAQLTAPFHDPSVVGVKGSYRTRQREITARFVQQEYEAKYARLARLETIDFIDTYSAAYRREVFLQNRGFDPAFPAPSVEDQEFSFRLARKGYRLVFAPQAVVFHQHDRTWREYARRKAVIGYWKAFMLGWIPEKTFNDSHTLPSQRVQIVLLAGMGLLLLGLTAAAAGFFSSLPALLPTLIGALFLTMLLFFGADAAFLRQVAQRDPGVLPAAAWLLLVRAAALGLGLMVGILFPPRQKGREKTRAVRWGERLIKRLLDLAGSAVGLVVFAPLILTSALAVILEDGGPAFYFQLRAGQNGKPFRMVKLRTMVVGADSQVDKILKHNPLNGPVFKLPNDPRVTRVGRFLRRWSLDELPQLWNVLVGEMSLVGPRPEEMWVVEQYTDKERKRLAVKPGLTGPMQVNGRGALDMEARLALELDYIENYSLLNDLVVLIQTAPAVLRGKGAY